MKNKKEFKTKFLDVDLWQKEFSPISVKAICEIYAEKFGVQKNNINHFHFPKYLNKLRELEDSNYKAPNFGTGVA